MPAIRLQRQVESLSRFDVVGEDGDVALFVRHVGLASQANGQVRHGDPVAVDHMGPPLARDATITANVAGKAELTYGEVKQVENFIEAHLGEHRAQKHLGHRRYVIRPHAKPFQESDGTTVCMRFSCVGFVIEAYLDAGIDLLDTNDESLPSVDRETLGKVYPSVLSSSWAKLNKKYDWGLEENKKEAWPVVLPAYVIHALKRKSSRIRDGAYKAKLGDEVFPG